MSAISLFEEKQVRRAWNAAEEKWYFSITDVVAVLTDSVDPGAYWRKLKERLKKEGNETVTNCHGLKMTAADGKQRMTDVANMEHGFQGWRHHRRQRPPRPRNRERHEDLHPAQLQSPAGIPSEKTPETPPTMNSPSIVKSALLAALLLLAPAAASGNSADSANVTVDTRDLVIGDLVIQGPTTMAPFQNTQYTAMLGGVDVSSQCTWPLPKCSRSFVDWSGYPGINGLGMLDPNSAQPGDVITITARYAEPGGDTRQAVKTVTVGNDGGLYFGIDQDIDYLGPAGAQFEWNASASVTGLAAGQPNVTFSWYLNGVPQGTGLTWEQTPRRGLPTVDTLKVVASDGQGHSSEQSVSLDFRALAPGEPGQRYDFWRKRGLVFVDEHGNPTAPDPAKKAKGLILITHGIWTSPYVDWIKDLAAAIENQLAGPGLPNIVIFGWQEASNPGKLYGTAPERLETVASSINLSSAKLRVVFPDGTGPTDFLFDTLMIREVAKDLGRASLAEWIRDEELSGNISKTAPIHLIGHSAGGFVMGECYKELKNDFNIQRVTMLDTPFAQRRHVDEGNPAVVERYVSSILGRICLTIDPILGSAGTSLLIIERPDSTWYHRLDVGNRLDTWNPLKFKEGHSYSHEWYQETVSSNSEQEGFQLSPFVTGASLAAPPPVGPQNAPVPQENGGGPLESPLPPTSLSGFTTFGTVSGAGNPYVLTENGNAGIVKPMTLPPDASGLTFEYQFTSPGDGDFLVVFFGDSPPLFIASPTASNTTGIATAEVSLAPYAGQTGNLVIKLVAQQTANAVVTVNNILMTLDDDIDGDGLLAASELAAGTDPRFADTDGDGITDPTELNTTLTNPVMADSDGDGANDGSELAAGTNPLDGSSRFAVKSSMKAGVDFTITWASQSSRSYRIIRSTEPTFQSYDVVASGIAAAPPQQSFVDAGGATASRMFYRVELAP